MTAVDSILIVKIGALGDVLRTTALLPGLLKSYPGARITWVVAAGAAPLIDGWPGVVEPCVLDLEDPESTIEVLSGRSFSLVVSLDEEEACCRVACSVKTERFVGAFIDEAGSVDYTVEARAWFDMSLISRFGKERADELKIENQRTHPELLASMAGVEEGRPDLPLPKDAERRAASFWETEGLQGVKLVVGLNTGSGARWPSKQVDEARTVEAATSLSKRLNDEVAFLVLGGKEEEARSARILEGLRTQGLTAASSGSANSLHEFAALVSRCDLIITSDSLCLHVAIARRVSVVAFFAPTSAQEIELYGMGEKVVSTTPDQCSYRPDADNSTITPARLVEAALGALRDRGERERRKL